MKMYRFDLKLGWGKIVCKPRSPFVQSMFDRSATSMASSELSGSSSTLMAPSFDESNIMGLPSFLGFGANAPVIAEMSITPSSINPVGTARHGAVHSHNDTTSTPCKFTIFQRFSFPFLSQSYRYRNCVINFLDEQGIRKVDRGAGQMR